MIVPVGWIAVLWACRSPGAAAAVIGGALVAWAAARGLRR